MVIVVMGPAGSGKSTVGRALAAALGWLFIDGDDHHSPANVQLMRAGHPLGDDQRLPWLRELHDIIARAMDRREHAVLACSALKASYRDLLRGDLRQVRFVYLHADRSLLLSRLEGRAHHFAGPDLLDSQLATLEPPQGDTAIVVDAAREPLILVSIVRTELGV
jgi:carbohydrate kinase (thermoresistant glucokinase family)